MGGKNSAPTPPDLSGVAAASKEAADKSFQLGEDQLQWAKDQFAQNQGTTNKVVDELLSTQDQQNQQSQELYDRYKSTYEPAQDQYLQDANNWDSQGREDQQAGAAQAQVAQNYDAARNSATQQLESFGVNPASTRFAALDIGTRTQQAADMAAAGNNSRVATQQQGMALRAGAINMGNGLPAQATSAAGTSTGAGTGAVGSDNSTFATGSTAMTAPSAWNGQGIGAIGNWGNTLNQGYANQLNEFKANQTASSGIGSLLGTAAGIGAKFAGFAEGGAVPELHADAGGAIPVGASPSNGAVTDDIPARLNAGEFVFPKDVTAWLGEKTLQQTIMKARQEKQGAVAKPAIGTAAPRPQQGAIPMRAAA